MVFSVLAYFTGAFSSREELLEGVETMTSVKSQHFIITGCFAFRDEIEKSLSKDWNFAKIQNVKGVIISSNVGKDSSEIANLYKSVVFPSKVVLIGEIPEIQSSSSAVSPLYNLETPFGKLSVMKDLIYELSFIKALSLDDTLFERNNPLNCQFAYIASAYPDAKVLPIILSSDISEDEMSMLAKLLNMKLAGDEIIILSSNAYFNEEDILKFQEYRAKEDIENSSAAYFFLGLMKSMGASKIQQVEAKVGEESADLYKPLIFQSQ